MDIKVVRGMIIEFLGVYMLCFMGGFAVNRFVATNHNVELLVNVAWAHVATIFFMICVGGPISGAQYHPGISIALIFTGDQKPLQGILFIVSQLIGSIAAGLSVILMRPKHFEANTGYPQMNAKDITVGQCFGLEFIATFFLAFGVFIGIRTKQSEKVIGAFVASTLTAAINGIGPATGASLNPARNFGPELVSGHFGQIEGWWVYYTACLFAPIVAALLVNYVIYPDGAEEVEVADTQDMKTSIEHSEDYGKV